MKKYKPENPMRSKIVFFEGLDKSGKSLLCRAARFAGDHEVLMFDRGFVGRRVFQEFRQEKEFPIRDWNFIEHLLAMYSAYGVVFLDIPAKISMARILAAGEKLEFTLEDLEHQRDLYCQEIAKLEIKGVPVLRIETALENENASLRKILCWIKGGEEWISEKTLNSMANLPNGSSGMLQVS